MKTIAASSAVAAGFSGTVSAADQDELDRLVDRYDDVESAEDAVGEYAKELVLALEQNYSVSSRDFLSIKEKDFITADEYANGSEGVFVSSLVISGTETARITVARETRGEERISLFAHPQLGDSGAVITYQNTGDSEYVTSQTLENKDSGGVSTNDVQDDPNCYRRDTFSCLSGGYRCGDTQKQKYAVYRCPNYGQDCVVGEYIGCCSAFGYDPCS